MGKITVNENALETMLYIWAAIKDKEKISDIFLSDFAESAEMEGSYDSEFTRQSVIKVLSAISNRERLNNCNKKESRFWNYNMWMLEDPEMTKMMLTPVKQLNIDALAKPDQEDIEVIFFPGHMDTYKIVGNKLFINFFSVKTDMFDETVITIEDKPIKDFIGEKLSEIY